MNTAGNWEEVDYNPDERGQKALTKTYTFKDFSEALEFVNKVGEASEVANHHPDIKLGWGYVKIWLTSHDEKKVTDRDHNLAKAIDGLL